MSVKYLIKCINDGLLDAVEAISRDAGTLISRI